MPRAARNPETGLTDKEEEFCQAVAYNPEMTDSDAYRKAYNCSRMKPETINVKANQLKNRDHIGIRIAQLREERAERTKIDADYVLSELQAIQEMDVIDIMNDDGSLLPVRQWPKTWRKYISGMDLTELFAHDDGDRNHIGFLKKIKWPDKVKNLELLGKHIDVQAFKDRVESNGTNLSIVKEIPADASPADAANAYRDMIQGL